MQGPGRGPPRFPRNRPAQLPIGFPEPPLASSAKPTYWNKITKTTIVDAKFTKTKLTEANLAKANFAKAKIAKAKLTKATSANSKFDEPI